MTLPAARDPLLCLAFAFGPLSYFAANGLALFTPLIALLAFRFHDRRAWRDLGGAGLWLGVAAVLALVSAVWAEQPGATVLRALRLAIEFAAGLAAIKGVAALPGAQQQRLLPATATGFAVAAGLAVAALAAQRALLPVEQWWEAALPFSRGAVLHAVLALPLAASLARARGRGLAFGFLALTAVAVALTPNLGARLALGIGMTVFVMVHALPALRWLMVAAMIGLAAGLPALLPVDLNGRWACDVLAHRYSAAHRLIIYNFAAAKIAERPLLGWGMDASRRLAEADRIVTLPHCGDGAEFVQMPLHPHDAFLQIRLELGLGGIALSLLLLLQAILGGFRAAAGDRLGLAAVTAAAAGWFVEAAIGFGLWQGWLMAALFWVVALTWLAARPAPVATE